MLSQIIFCSILVYCVGQEFNSVNYGTTTEGYVIEENNEGNGEEDRTEEKEGGFNEEEGNEGRFNEGRGNEGEGNEEEGSEEGPFHRGEGFREGNNGLEVGVHFGRGPAEFQGRFKRYSGFGEGNGMEGHKREHFGNRGNEGRFNGREGNNELGGIGEQFPNGGGQQQLNKLREERLRRKAERLNKKCHHNYGSTSTISTTTT